MLKTLKSIGKKLKGLKEKIIVKGNGGSKAALFDDVNISLVKQILRSGNFNQTMKLYKTMLKRDSQISGDLGERKMKVLGSSYTIECEDKKLQEFINSYFQDIKFSLLLTDINSGIDYGYSIVDLVWDKKHIDNSTYFLPTKFNFIDQSFVGQDDKKGLFIQSNGSAKHYLEEQPLKILFHEHKLDAGGILDYSILSKLIWIFAIKHFIISQSMSYAEMLGVPPIVVNSESNDKSSIMQMFEQVLELRSGSAGVFGKDDKVSLIEGKANGELFMKFITYADNQITHTILGGTMSNSNSSGGSYAKDKVHNEVKQAYHIADMRLISDTFNDLIKKIVDVNFSNIKEYPKFKFQLDSFIDADTLKTLQDMGIPISIEEIQDMYKLNKKVSKNDTAKPSTNTPKTEKNKRETNSKKKPKDPIDLQLNSLDTKGMEEDVFSSIESIVEDADSIQEAIALIEDKYQDIDTDSLEKMLGNIIFNSSAYGDLDVESD